VAVTPKAGPLVLTMGEPAGIGGEITLKAWLARTNRSATPFFTVADPDHLSATAAALGFDVAIKTIENPEDAWDVFDTALPVITEPLPGPVTPGQPSKANASAVIASIRRAAEFVRTEESCAMVTNPIHKKILADTGFPHPGHTEYLAELTDTETPIMMLACPGLRVVPVTIHVALNKAIKMLSTDAIKGAARITARALTTDFGIPTPRLAVAALNPHAGEDGMMGEEDQTIIAPAIQTLAQEGIDVFGPAAPDSLFHARARETYDAVICMYHDQALIPLKTVDFDQGVDITLGLPIVRTSPDHGTAFDIAGRGIARESSLLAAMDMALEISQNRSLAKLRKVIGRHGPQ
jgi:4-hydroxythreonine-4-phosphate dehydrogenase